MNSISKWMLLLIGFALCGYAIFTFEYYTIANGYHELLQDNSTYVELERHVRDVSTSHHFAMFVATNVAALPAETVKSAAVQFVEAARSAAKANTVSAFEFHFGPILSGAMMVEDAVSKPTIDLEKLREGLDAAAQMMNLLVLIAGEGRKAELDNLMERSQFNFVPLIAMISAYAFFVAVMGYLITAHIRRTFANVSRTNSSIANGDRGVDAGRAPFAELRALGQRWKPTRTVVVVALIVALGFGLVVIREPLQQGMADLIPALGTADPTDAAYNAYQNDDAATALRLSQPLAEQGNARAQTLVGLIYYLGRGVPRDESEARKWFGRAADQGDADAPFHLGGMYFEGRGVAQDFLEAAKWYHLAADRNNPRAEYNLGILYFNGKGVPQNNVMAYMWFNLAAARYPASDPRSRRVAMHRDIVARYMSREAIEDAQKLTREWKPK
jgi:uncharacterized protein